MNRGRKSRSTIAGGLLIAAVAAFAFGLGHHLVSRKLPTPEPIAAAEGSAASAAAAALAEPNELLRAGRLLLILESLPARDLDEVVGAYEATFTSVGPGSVAMELLCEAWAGLDAEEALRRISGWGDYWRGMALPLLMRSWARRDPASAREALPTIEPVKLRSAASAGMIRGWADSGDPEVWESYLAGLPLGQEAARDLMLRVAEREGIGRLLQRVQNLPEGTTEEFKRRAWLAAVGIAARSEPSTAAAFVERNNASPYARGLHERLVRSWVSSDGPRAMEWVMAQPPDPARDDTLRAAFTTWLGFDDDAALAWAEGQPDPTLDPVRDLYARAVAKTDPRRAVEIAEGIPEGEGRRQALLQVGQVWLAHDPEAARSWIEENGFDRAVDPNRRWPKQVKRKALRRGRRTELD